MDPSASDGEESLAGEDGMKEPKFSDIAPLLGNQMRLPATFGHHRLLREVNRGGMGVVYEAEDGRLGRTVALKLIRGVAFSSLADRARFNVEAAAAAALDHPHIVRVYEIGEIENQPYFTMKFIEGGTLADRLRKGPMPAREACALMVKVCRAVHHAHQRGVLHRDIKPGNILLEAGGEPVLTDFGLAKLMDAETGLTLSSAHLGTPHYMSPEQAEGRVRDIGTASDVWALGVVLFELLTGDRPFTGRNAQEIMRHIVEDDLSSTVDSGKSRTQAGGAPETMTTDRHRLPPDLRTLVLRCLEKDPARRLPGADFLADELASWLRGEPIRSRPVTTLERWTKWCRRHPGRVAAVVALGLSIIAGSITSLVLWQRAERARTIADSRAAEAVLAKDAMAREAYFSVVANALNLRARGDFRGARDLLNRPDASLRAFEWQLVHGLCQGDDDWAVRVPSGPGALAYDPAAARIVALGSDRRLRWLAPHSGEVTEGPLLAGDAGESTESFSELAISPDGVHWACARGAAVLVGKMETGEIVQRTGVPGVKASLGWMDNNRLIYAGTAARGESLPAGTQAVGVIDVAEKTARLLPLTACGPVAVSMAAGKVAWVEGPNVALRPFTGLEGAPSNMFPARTLGAKQLLAGRIAFSGHGSKIAIAWTGETDFLEIKPLAGTGTAFVKPHTPIAALICSTSDSAVILAEQYEWLRSWNYSQEASAELWDDGLSAENTPHEINGPYLAPQRFLTRTAQHGRTAFYFGSEALTVALADLPDQQAFVSLGADGVVRRFPLTPRAPLNRFAEVNSSYQWNHPSASPDGSRVLYRGSNNNIRLWQRRSGSQTDLAPNQVPLAVFDDGRVFTLDPAAQELVAWQAEEGKARETARTAATLPVEAARRLRGGEVFACSAVSPDGRIMAALFDGLLLGFDG